MAVKLTILLPAVLGRNRDKKLKNDKTHSLMFWIMLQVWMPLYNLGSYYLNHGRQI